MQNERKIHDWNLRHRSKITLNDWNDWIKYVHGYVVRYAIFIPVIHYSMVATLASVGASARSFVVVVFDGRTCRCATG